MGTQWGRACGSVWRTWGKEGFVCVCASRNFADEEVKGGSTVPSVVFPPFYLGTFSAFLYPHPTARTPALPSRPGPFTFMWCFMFCFVFILKSSNLCKTRSLYNNPHVLTASFRQLSMYLDTGLLWVKLPDIILCHLGITLLHSSRKLFPHLKKSQNRNFLPVSP